MTKYWKRTTKCPITNNALLLRLMESGQMKQSIKMVTFAIAKIEACNYFEFRFCQKCYTPPQNTKRVFFLTGKNGRIYSTWPNVGTVKNIEVTTHIKTQKARLAQIELLIKLNKCKKPFIIITQEPYCYKSTQSLLAQKAKTMPSNRKGHPKSSISAGNRLHMEEITELSF